jgi:hypothetical protein
MEIATAIVVVSILRLAMLIVLITFLRIALVVVSLISIPPVTIILVPALLVL